MPVVLTTPVVNTVKVQAIKNIIMEIPYVVETSGELRINRNGFTLRSDIGNYGDTPNKLEKEATMIFSWDDLPAAGQTALKSLYQWLESQAVAQGHIGAGTTNDPEPTE